MKKIRTILLLSTVVVVVTWVTDWGLRAATPDEGPTVIYQAQGTFGTPPVSGDDTLKLAGEPFTINIVAHAGSTPSKHGQNWAVFTPLRMTGVVHSGLLGSQPVNIASNGTSIYLSVSATEDPVEAAFPVVVVGISLTVQAQFTLPADTLAKPLIDKFAAVQLSPSITSVVYSNGTDTTTLSIASGTLQAGVHEGSGQ